MITALGYIGVRSDRLSDWSDFASGLLGMQRIDRAGKQLAFRMDDRHQRVVVTGEPGDALAFLGWEVQSSAALDTYDSNPASTPSPSSIPCSFAPLIGRSFTAPRSSRACSTVST